MRSLAVLPLLLVSAILLAAAPVTAQPAPDVAPSPATAAAATPANPRDEIDRLLRDLGGSQKARKAARQELMRRGAKVVPRVLPSLASGSWPVRWEAVNILGNIGDRRGIPGVVERVVGDPSPHVRWRAIWALNNIKGGGKQTGSLLAAELAGTDPARRWNAAVGLAATYDKRALPVLIEGLETGNDWKRWEAVTNLARVHDADTGAHLARRFETETGTRVRREIALTLGAICDEPGRGVLARAIDDPDPQVRWRAARSIGKCREQTLRPALVRRQAEEKDKLVRENIQGALDRLGDGAGDGEESGKTAQ